MIIIMFGDIRSRAVYNIMYKRIMSVFNFQEHIVRYKKKKNQNLNPYTHRFIFFSPNEVGSDVFHICQRLFTIKFKLFYVLIKTKYIAVRSVYNVRKTRSHTFAVEARTIVV